MPEVVHAKAAGRRFYRDALEHIATIEEVRILTVGLPTRYPVDTYRLWFWMMYALLVERPQGPRPRLPLTIIDGEDMSFRGAQDLVAHRFYRSFPCQPYVAKGRGWFVGGSALQNSHLHPFVQMADLVAGAGRHALAKREPISGWYDKHLVKHASKTRKQAIEVLDTPCRSSKTDHATMPAVVVGKMRVSFTEEDYAWYHSTAALPLLQSPPAPVTGEAAAVSVARPTRAGRRASSGIWEAGPSGLPTNVTPTPDSIACTMVSACAHDTLRV